MQINLKLFTLAILFLSTTSQLLAETKEERFYRMTGGFVYKKNPDSKPFTVVNTSEIMPDDVARRVMDEINSLLQIETVVTHRNAEITVLNAEDNFADFNAGAVLYIVDSDQLPPILMAPENKWGLLNAKCLIKDSPKPEVLNSRFSKEIWRAFSLVCGAGDNSATHCLLRPLFSLRELDALTSKTISVEPLLRMEERMKKLHITPVLKDTYYSACEEGWAPAPTNDIQKAIWDKVHSIPDKPLKIQFDPGTQKGKVTK